MKRVNKSNKRKSHRRKHGGTTMRKTQRSKKTVPKPQTSQVALPPSKLVVEGYKERKPSDQTLPVAKLPPVLVVLGKIYSDQCIHCQNMAGAWEEMKQNLPDNYTVWDIESKDEENKKKEFQNQHGVQLRSSGYPTIFMIVNGKQLDYNGDRGKEHLLQWAQGLNGNQTQ